MKSIRLNSWFILLILLPFAGKAQCPSKKNIFSVNGFYPIPVGWDFVNLAYGNGYNGNAGIALDYSHSIGKHFYGGFNLETDLFYLKKTNVNLEIFKPSLHFIYPYHFKKLDIISRLDCGYGFWRYYSDYVTNTTNDGDSYYETTNAFMTSARLAVSYPVFKNVYVNMMLRYEYSRLKKPSTVTSDFSYYQNIQILYPGLGIEFRL